MALPANVEDGLLSNSLAAANPPLMTSSPPPSSSSSIFTRVLLFQHLHAIRWVVLFTYCMLNGVNNLLGMTFSTVVDQSVELFGCSIYHMNLLDSLLTIVFGLTAIPLSFLFDRFGLRAGIVTGSVLNFVGAVGRLVVLLIANNAINANDNGSEASTDNTGAFVALFFFQMCIAFGMAFALGIPSLVSAAWFGAHERGTATSIGNASGFVGMAVGYILSPAIVTEDSVGDGGTNPSLLKTQFVQLLLVNVGFCASSLLLSVFFVGDMPPVAPSITARRVVGASAVGLVNATTTTQRAEGDKGEVEREDEETESAPVIASSPCSSSQKEAEEEEATVGSHSHAFTFSYFFSTLKRLFTIKSYLILLFVITLSNGVFGGLAYLLAQVNQPFGVSNLRTGWIGCIGGFTSIFGCVLLGRIMDKKRRYKGPLVGLNFFYTFTLCATMLSYAAEWQTVANAYVWLILFNILQGSIASVAFEYAVELTFPINEGISGTVTMAIPNILNGIIVFVASSLFGSGAAGKQTAMTVFLICTIMCSLATLAALLMREGDVRAGIEKKATTKTQQVAESDAEAK